MFITTKLWACHGFSDTLRSIDASLKRINMDYIDLLLIHEPTGDVHEIYRAMESAYLRLPVQDAWGVVMRKDDPLAQRKVIQVSDLRGLPLICSRQGMREEMVKWFGDELEKLNIVATYDLLYNASILTREGLGYAIGFKDLVNTGPDSELCVRPLEPPLASPMYLIWKKYQVFTPVASLLLEELKGQITHGQEE